MRSLQEIKKRLQEIALEMNRPEADLEKLSQELDELLEFELPAEDKELAGAWERSHR